MKFSTYFSRKVRSMSAEATYAKGILELADCVPDFTVFGIVPVLIFGCTLYVRRRFSEHYSMCLPQLKATHLLDGIPIAYCRALVK